MVDNIKHCVSGNKNEYLMDCPIVLNACLLKIGINISRENVLAVEYAMYELHQRKTFLPCCRLSAIGTFPITSYHFCVPNKPCVHSTSKFLKIRHLNLTSRTTYHINKWENDGLMDGYYVVGVIDILYPRFGVFINIVSKEDNS